MAANWSARKSAIVSARPPPPRATGSIWPRAISGCAGAGAALGALGDGSRPVNLLLALFAILGLHALTFLAWLLSFGVHAQVSGLGRLWLWLTRKLARSPDAALAPRALVELLARNGALRWMLGGAGSATAEGRVDNLTVRISGSGKARLGKLMARRVRVTVAGSGDATIAPQDEAHVTILGSGDVYLATRPRRIERRIMGSGNIIEAR